MKTAIHGLVASLCVLLGANACVTDHGARSAAPRGAWTSPPWSDAIPPGTPTRVASPLPHSVRFVYLVSADLQPRESFRRAIESAARDVQAYYRREVGDTFALNTPVVEVVRSDKPSTWFYATPTARSANQEDRGYYNTLDEVNRILGADRNQPYRWIVYSDGPGNKGRGGDGVAVLPNDGHFDEMMQRPTDEAWNRWNGGLAHELGHALGLPEAPEGAPEIMARWYDYPHVGLSETDERFLRESVFFGPPAMKLATFAYSGGRFERRARLGQVSWVELTDKGDMFQFVERASFDPSSFWLVDARRSLQIQIPVFGGMSRIAGGGAAFHDLYPVRPVLW